MIQTIQIISDQNILTYSSTKLKDKKPILEYVYTESKTKMGMVLPLTQVELDGLIKQNIAIIIK